MRPVDDNFHQGEITLQSRWQTRESWDSDRREQLLWDHLPEMFHDRFSRAPYFFLATSSDDGSCDCSFKGGGAGLIKLLNTKQFAFPDFDGNGAFMSLGNILVNPHVGCLFIDFEDGARLRVNGRAEIHQSGKVKDLFTDAARVVLINIEQVIPNCNRFIPLMSSQAEPGDQ